MNFQLWNLIYTRHIIYLNEGIQDATLTNSLWGTLYYNNSMVQGSPVSSTFFRGNNTAIN